MGLSDERLNLLGFAWLNPNYRSGKGAIALSAADIHTGGQCPPYKSCT
ncbi:MAG: hypothetical protein ACTS2F_13255 [Thainema sp.]